MHGCTARCPTRTRDCHNLLMPATTCPCTQTPPTPPQVKKIKKEIKEDEDDVNDEEVEAPCHENIWLSYFFGTVCDDDGKLGRKFKDDAGDGE